MSKKEFSPRGKDYGDPEFQKKYLKKHYGIETEEQLDEWLKGKSLNIYLFVAPIAPRPWEKGEDEG